MAQFLSSMAVGLTTVIFLSTAFLPRLIYGQEAYQTVCLNGHNENRNLHQNTPPMTLDTDLDNKAVECAKYYANLGRIDHSCKSKGNAGENLYQSSGRSPNSVTATNSAIKAWYNEGSRYNYNSNQFSAQTGHFTQVIWVKSTKLGCGYANKGNQEFFVSLYSPAGNFQGQYTQNVKPLK